MKKQLTIITIITAIGSAIAFYAFPQVTDLPGKVDLAICFAVLIPQLFAIWAFLTSLGVFKKELKIAYYMLALSSLFLSLNQIQLPLTSLFPTVDPVVLGWFIAAIMLFGSALLYISMHTFAKLLALKSRFWGSYLFVSVSAVLLAAASAFIPHISYDPISETTINGIFGTYVAGGGFAVAAAIVAWRIKGKLGPSYRTAMSWLIAGAVMLAFSSFHETLLRLLPVLNKESLDWYTLYGFSLWPLFMVAVSFLCAGLSFRRLSKELADLPEDASYLDVIDYVTRLISNPQSIDVTLDKVRQITARSTAGELSAADKSSIISVYKEIEEYLVAKDPLVKIAREDLRARLPSSFRRAVEGSAGQESNVMHDV